MPITVNPIAVVHNSVTEPVDTGWGEVQSTIVLNPEWAGALVGLDQFSHALILTYLHRVAIDEDGVPRQRRPRNRDDMPLIGVFAQRARVRPNPIGVTTCPIVRLIENELVVSGLDAIDGTPVLDVKPYIPVFDDVESPVVPAWVDELLQGYR
jgi:tRNA-Thr(GGU) m(6)t(6)A37 methyltransferase TsaA